MQRGQPLEAAIQQRNIEVAAAAIANVAQAHTSSSPTTTAPGGLLALQAEAYRAVSPYPGIGQLPDGLAILTGDTGTRIQL